MGPVESFPELLAMLLRDGAPRPLVTAYDDATGERVELSVTTYANWVAKTANLLVDELMLDPGDTVLLDLPPHWLGTVFLGGAWAAGLAVAAAPTARAADPEIAAVVCGPEDPARHLGRGVPVVACSLAPFAGRFTDPLPEGVLDHGALWPGQSDVFEPVPTPGPDTVAWHPGAGTQADLLDRAALAGHGGGPVRLLTDADPCLDQGVPAFLRPLLSGGSVVLVRHPDDSRWPARRESERATEELRRAPARERTPD